jgi:hypothetical protein
MKRFGLIIGVGLLICAAAYSGAYFCGTAPARRMVQEKYPELAWLKQEFKLSDAEFTRVAELHVSYQPHCAEMCRRIAAKNAEIKEVLAKGNEITPELEQKLAEAAALRAECQKAMLQHFIEVSRSMPTEEGKRYLAWVEDKTFLSGQGMSMPGMAAHHDHGNE